MPADPSPISIAIGTLQGSAISLRAAGMEDVAQALESAAKGLAGNPAPRIDCTDWPDRFWKLAMRYYQNGLPGFNHECEKLLREFLAANPCTRFHEDGGDGERER